MNDTVVTVVGNVATGVEFRESASGGVARFRFAVTARRWDRLKNVWADGPTSFYTVWAWRTLGANLAASVSVGEPLVVHGRLRVREDEREGERRVSADIDALAVGHDLTRGTSAFRRVARAASSLTERHKATAQGDEGQVRERPRERHGPERHGQEPFPEPVAEPVAAVAAAGAGAVVPDRGGGMIPRAIPVA